MIRKFLTREGQFLLQEFGAPDSRTLLRRALFWLYFYTATATILFGVVAVYELFGVAAMWVAVAALFLFYVWLQNRTGGYGGADSEMYDWMGVAPPGNPQLPPPGTQALPAPGPRQLSMSQRPALPGPKK